MQVSVLKKREKILADAVEMLQQNEKTLHMNMIELYKDTIKQIEQNKVALPVHYNTISL